MENQFNDLSVPDVNAKYYYFINNKSSGFTHLMKLVLMVNKFPEALQIIENIIKDPNEINKKNNEGYTALMIACINVHRSNNLVIKMLIDSGANLDIQNNNNDTALTLSSMYMPDHSDPSIVKMLVLAGASVHIKGTESFTALLNVITFSSCEIETIKLLIDVGSDVNHQDTNGYTALMRYCDRNGFIKLDIVKLLIDVGSDINTRNNYGLTSLMLAHYDVDLILLLINLGADVNMKYYKNRTFLMVILLCLTQKSREKYTGVIIELIHRSKYTLGDIDSDGKTAYDYYVKYGYNILDDYHLELLKGKIRFNRTKSAKVK